MKRIPHFTKKITTLKSKQLTSTYPGVYVKEIATGLRTIEGVATSITAFVGRTASGPVNQPTSIRSFGDFEKQFGGLWRESPLSYAVRCFFLNGGREAVVVRIVNGGSPATIALPCGPDESLNLTARNIGSWGRSLKASVNHSTNDLSDNLKFNLVIQDGRTGARETFLNVSADSADPRFVGTLLEQRSKLVAVLKDAQGNHPILENRPDAGMTNADQNSGDDGTRLTALELTGPHTRSNQEGLYALEKVDLLNLLVIPPYNASDDIDISVIHEAADYCEKRRAFMIIGPPSSWTQPASAESGIIYLGTRSANAAVYFPRIQLADPLQNDQMVTQCPSGTVAGVFARTDTNRGVWKSPAGAEASLRGVLGLELSLDDLESNELNPLGINCLRSFPQLGAVIWGSRTLQGHNQSNSEWKHIAVRRTALFIEESLYRGTRWAVFEPNNAHLWSQIRSGINTFLNGLFRKGAFQGAKPEQAFFVKCGLGDTMTQEDVSNRRLIIQVGFAPLKPAEFVMLSLQHRTAPQ